jgi:hypothetical protein
MGGRGVAWGTKAPLRTRSLYDLLHSLSVARHGLDLFLASTLDLHPSSSVWYPRLLSRAKKRYRTHRDTCTNFMTNRILVSSKHCCYRKDLRGAPGHFYSPSMIADTCSSYSSQLHHKVNSFTEQREGDKDDNMSRIVKLCLHFP